MNADQQSALDQWNLAYASTEGLLNSIERCSYNNQIVLTACLSALRIVNQLVTRMLSHRSDVCITRKK